MRYRLFAVCILTLVFLASCAPSQMALKVDLPTPMAPKANGKKVFIRSVTDVRTFADKTASPDTPSWGSDNPALTTPQIKAHAVARNAQLGGKDFGGNILLEGEQTVENMVRNATSASFTQAGYTVVEGSVPPDSGLVVDISIEHLWGVFDYKRFASEMSAKLEVRINIHMPGDIEKTFVTKSSYKNTVLHFNQENWEKAFDTLMYSYIQGLEGEILKIKE